MQVSFFLGRVEMPNDIIWKTINPVPGDFGQLRKSFRFNLMIHWFEREIDA